MRLFLYLKKIMRRDFCQWVIHWLKKSAIRTKEIVFILIYKNVYPHKFFIKNIRNIYTHKLKTKNRTCLQTSETLLKRRILTGNQDLSIPFPAGFFLFALGTEKFLLPPAAGTYLHGSISMVFSTGGCRSPHRPYIFPYLSMPFTLVPKNAYFPYLRT